MIHINYFEFHGSFCCMVWYGMVWYGMVWYGMVWYGMVYRILHIFLGGCIPQWILNTSHIITLNLSHCRLRGSIPSEIYELTHLVALILSYNSFEGFMYFDMVLDGLDKDGWMDGLVYDLNGMV